MNEKTCPKCSEVKPKDEFYNSKTTKDGKDTYCKECRKAANRKWVAANPDYAKDYWRNVRKAELKAAREFYRQHMAQKAGR